MGINVEEKMRMLGILKFSKGSLDVEFNTPRVLGQSNIIHLRNEFICYEMAEDEFLQAVGTILEGERQLRWLKGKKYE